MKPTALLFALALLPVADAHSKTVDTTESGSNQKSVSGVAGPAAAARNSGPAQAVNQQPVRHPGKKALRKAKVTPPPPMHDPN